MMTTLPFFYNGIAMRKIFSFLVIFLFSHVVLASDTDNWDYNMESPPCDNVTNSGTITGAQSSCGSFYPTSLLSTSPASGGSGVIEYQWMYKSASTGWNLQTVVGATMLDYTPGLLSETTKFVRCSRTQGCTSWPGETSSITITVTNACCNVTNAGIIGNTQTSCGPFDPSPIVSIAPASGGTGLIEYVWMYRSASTNWGLTMIPNSNSETYDPGYLTETTKFRRCSRNIGCTSWPGETTDLLMTVSNSCCNVTQSGAIGNAQINCGAFDPAPITSLSPASGGSGIIEYIWMYSNATTNDVLTVIPGTNSETYDPGYITETTRFRRCSRNVGCSNWPGETTDLYMTVNPIFSATATSTAASCSDTIKVCTMSDYNGSRTIWMPNLGGTSVTSNFKIINNSAKLYQFSDGTAHYVGKAQSTVDANKQWVFSVWFKDKKDWSTWNAGGGSYKNGGGTTNHTNWDYYIMDASKTNSMIGLLDYAGIELNLTHMPSSYLYAMQLGQGANDHDGDFGMSFWFNYTSTNSAFSAGHGDFNADAACTDLITCGGSASAAIVGGVAPYIYEWSNGIYGDYNKDLCIGTYNVTVTDANGCVANASTSISSSTCCLMSSAGTIGNAQAGCGPFDPMAFTNLSSAIGGGTGVIEYQWMYENSTTSGVLTAISGANNAVYDPGMINETTQFRRYSRIQGCSGWPGESNDITITINASPLATVTNTNATGNGVADGTATIIANGGTLPYSYLWSDGQTTATANGLASGTYLVTVTDVNGCTTSESVVINEPIALSVTVTSSAVLCNGGNDGTAMVSIAGGTSPYTYLWSTGATNDSVSGLTDGNYSVTVTDANGYSILGTVLVNEPTALTNTNISVLDVTCNGGNDGLVSLNASGGTAPYTYAWSNGQTTPNVIGLSAGSYSISITDSNACNIVVSTAVNEPTVLSNNSVNITDASCNGTATGTIALQITGGSSPYTYAWSNGQTNAVATGLTAGVHSVVVTDVNGCSLSINNLTVNQPLTFAVETAAATNTSCFGACDGFAIISLDGGTFPYTYLWSNGATDPVSLGLCAGTYSVTVTDANGCSLTENNILVAEPAPIENSSTSIVDVTCNGYNNGSATVHPTGGTAPYSYVWSDGQTTATATGLMAGLFSVTISDANGCSVLINDINVSEPDLLINTNTSIVNTSCFGTCDGSISVAVTGGTAPYTYAWTNVVFNQINGDGTAVITDLCKGLYAVVVTDANGCTIAIDSILIASPSPLFNNNPTITPVSCFGETNGSIDLDVMGGTLPYTYAWSNGVNTELNDNLSAGSYSVTVTDANGCAFDVSNVIITEPTLLSNSNTTIVAVSCNGLNDGSITVNPTGGTAPYTYAWSNGAITSSVNGLTAGVYNVVITDANGCSFNENNMNIMEPTPLVISTPIINPASCFGICDGSITISLSGGTAPYTYAWSQFVINQINGDGTPEITDLCKGIYSVLVTDANGCTVSLDSVQISEPPAVFNNNMVVSNISCNGSSDGAIDLDIFGGTSPYSYTWNNGDSTESIDGLSPGVYSVIVTDVNGCGLDENNILITEPLPMLAPNNVVSNISCAGICDGLIQLNVTGGILPYNYNWNTGDSSMLISNLCAGNYAAAITDANGCTLNVSGMTITEPMALSAGLISTEVQCYTGCDGSINTTITGGTAPFLLDWNNGSTNSNLINLCAGVYAVSIIDANGCTVEDSVAISQPNELHSISTTTDASCFGVCDGTSATTVTGGTMPYSFLWNTGDTTNNVTGLCADSYNVIVTDANGCVAVNSSLILAPAEIQVAFVVDYNSASIQANGMNGVLPYTYNWANGSVGNTISNLVNGEYFLTLTDANGCSVNDSIEFVDGGGIINQFTVNVGPNPFYNDTKLSISTTQSSKIVVDIYDATGNIIEETFNGMLIEDTEFELIINSNSIKPGMYLCRILAEDGSAITKKLMVVK
ncbi:hypothetical protein DNU06_03745 [Putridiphycobacter roseus]|uniref:Secretion system C-terminal sorting domain-containing protein n=1 Tax=Putridiphycobacter roseus TaxID=2219161 RepID=A0A2W1NTG9_9FLAO|nr:T9SS type A sorting domain-containing protein [Putridiphycobacter roseus]PZE18952.1 hypothetical protein DNU06_03745 [Putridiphycobacter roseus]